MSYTEEKSHVGMGYDVCPVCMAEHDPVVMLDRRLRKTLTRHEFTGWAMCPEHQKLKDEGYIALVECTNSPRRLEDAVRTGRVAHVRASVWPSIFNVPAPEQGLCFVEDGMVERLAKASNGQA